MNTVILMLYYTLTDFQLYLIHYVLCPSAPFPRFIFLAVSKTFFPPSFLVMTFKTKRNMVCGMRADMNLKTFFYLGPSVQDLSYNDSESKSPLISTINWVSQSLYVFMDPPPDCLAQLR